MLVRLTGDKAIAFIKDELTSNKAKAFEISDADEKKTQGYMDKQFNSSSVVPTVGKYKNDKDAHIIDTYSLLDCNCAIKSEEGAEQGGSKVDFTEYLNIGTDGEVPDRVISPSGLQDYLEVQSKDQNSNVKDVTTQVTQESNPTTNNTNAKTSTNPTTNNTDANTKTKPKDNTDTNSSSSSGGD